MRRPNQNEDFLRARLRLAFSFLRSCLLWLGLLGAKSRHVGDKCEIMRPEHSEHPELTGRQMADKCEMMRPEH